MDWSIHFLSGNDTIFNAKKNDWIKLTLNPLKNNNAHGHLKNHPSGAKETKKVVELLEKQNGLLSYYPFPLHHDQAAKSIEITKDIPTDSDWTAIHEYQNKDYNNILKFSCSRGAKVIFVSLDDSLILYQSLKRTLDKLIYTDRAAESIEEIRNQIDSLFFGESVKKWNELGLTDIWDKRERLALSTRPLLSKKWNVDLDFEHYWIDSQTWWYDGKRKIQDLMKWLEVDIDQDRYKQWIPIYEQWQGVQLKVLDFQFNYKHIVESIINNWSFNIDLTFDQEVIIQHCLIYQHGLNLKTWKLEKFPNNTKELHKLLEPNTHPL